MQHQRTVKPILKTSNEAQEALYQRYIAPVAALAEGFNAEAHFFDSPSLAAIDGYSPNVHIIADVIAWAYNPIKDLPQGNLLTIIRLLDEAARQQFAEHTAGTQKKVQFRKESFFSPALAEIAWMATNENTPLMTDYLFYQTMAIMQLAVTMIDAERMTDAEQSHHFIGMRVGLERANFSLIMLLQQQTPSLKELAKKGGKKRFTTLYGPAYEYTQQRYNEIRVAKPSLSKRQIAKAVHEEAASHVAFRVMVEGNRERTIYQWILEM